MSARDDMAAYMRAYRAKKKRKRQCLECKAPAIVVKDERGKVKSQRLCGEHSKMHRVLQRKPESK